MKISFWDETDNKIGETNWNVAENVSAWYISEDPIETEVPLETAFIKLHLSCNTTTGTDSDCYFDEAWLHLKQNDQVLGSDSYCAQYLASVKSALYEMITQIRRDSDTFRVVDDPETGTSEIISTDEDCEREALRS